MQLFWDLGSPDAPVLSGRLPSTPKAWTGSPACHAANVEEFTAATTGEAAYRPLVQRLPEDAVASVETGSIQVADNYDLPDSDIVASAPVSTRTATSNGRARGHTMTFTCRTFTRGSRCEQNRWTGDERAFEVCAIRRLRLERMLRASPHRHHRPLTHPSLAGWFYPPACRLGCWISGGGDCRVEEEKPFGEGVGPGGQFGGD